MLVNERVSPRKANGKKITSKTLSRLVLAAAPGIARRAARWHCAVWQWAQRDSTRASVCSGTAHCVLCLACWAGEMRVGFGMVSSESLWEAVPGLAEGMLRDRNTQQHRLRAGNTSTPPVQHPALGLAAAGAGLLRTAPSTPHGVFLSEASTVGERCCKSQGFQSWLWLLMFKAENCIWSWRRSAGIKTKKACEQVCHAVALIIGNCIKWWEELPYREAGSTRWSPGAGDCVPSPNCRWGLVTWVWKRWIWTVVLFPVKILLPQKPILETRRERDCWGRVKTAWEQCCGVFIAWLGILQFLSRNGMIDDLC